MTGSVPAQTQPDGQAAEAVVEATDRLGGERDSPAADEHLAAEGVRRNAVFALLVQITTGVFTTAVTLVLVRILGARGVGLFALALGVARLALIAADVGIPFSAARFLAETGGNRRSAAGLLRDALRLKLITAAIVAVGVFAAAGLIAQAYGQPALTWPLRGIAVSLFAESLLGFYVAALIALGRNSLNLRLTLIESFVEASAIITLVALGAGATGATFGRAVGYSTGALAATYAIYRLFGRSLFAARSAGHTREIASYAAPMVIASGVYTFYSQIDVMIVGAILGTSAAGIFAAPMQLVIPLTYIGQALANSVAPRQAASAQGPNVQAFATSLRWLIIVQAALLGPILVWPTEITHLLLGSQFAQSADILRALAVFIFLRGLGPLISTTVNYLGRAQQRIPIVFGALAVMAVIDIVLLPRIGVVAAAIGASAAYSLYVPAHFVICWRVLGFDLRPLARTSLRALAATGAMSAVLLALGTGTLSIGILIAGAVGGTLAFAAVLLLTHEVSGAELRRGREAVLLRMSRLRVPLGVR